MTSECPACERKITLIIRPRVGQRLTCPSCRAELEVISAEPLELDFPFEIDDDDFEDDD